MEDQLVLNNQTDLNRADKVQAKFAQSPLEMRSQASRYMELAQSEADPQIRHGLAGCAFALSQLAESIERRRGGNRR